MSTPGVGTPAGQYLEQLAEDQVRDLTSNQAIRRYTKNPQLLGAYAEASVRALIARMVLPFCRVSRGAIVCEEIVPDSCQLPGAGPPAGARVDNEFRLKRWHAGARTGGSE